MWVCVCTFHLHAIFPCSSCNIYQISCAIQIFAIHLFRSPATFLAPNNHVWVQSGKNWRETKKKKSNTSSSRRRGRRRTVSFQCGKTKLITVCVWNDFSFIYSFALSEISTHTHTMWHHQCQTLLRIPLSCREHRKQSLYKYFDISETCTLEREALCASVYCHLISWNQASRRACKLKTSNRFFFLFSLRFAAAAGCCCFNFCCRHFDGVWYWLYLLILVDAMAATAAVTISSISASCKQTQIQCYINRTRRFHIKLDELLKIRGKNQIIH